MAAAAAQGTAGNSHFGVCHTSTIALLVALGLFLLKIWPGHRLYAVYGGRRRRYPPVAGTIFHQLFYFDSLHDYNAKLPSTDRKTFRLWIPQNFRHIYTVDPVIVEYILKTNSSNYGKGSFNHEKMKELLGDGIFSVDGDKWRHQRKLASFEFSTKVLRDFSSATFKSNAAKLARIVSKMSSAPQSMDIQDMFLKSTMDSIFKVGFGLDLNCLDGCNEKGTRFARAFDECNVVITMRYIDVMWKLKRLLNIGMEAQLRSNIKLIDEFIYDIIRSKKQLIGNNSEDTEGEKKNDILSRFLVESTKDPDHMTTRYLRDIVLNFVIAGKDTTAGTLAWFFYMMCKHPDVQQEVAREVRRATTPSSADEVSSGYDDIDEFANFASRLTDRALENMHLLHAALSETLRLYPAVPSDPKVCFSDDILPDGHEVRKGDIVYYHPYTMGRMKFLWGDDAEAFRPQRWLDENGQFRPESPFKFTAFQAGPRICLGKEFAYRQMKIFSALLLRFFSFKLKDEAKPVRYRTMLTLHVDGGLHVHATPRKEADL